MGSTENLRSGEAIKKIQELAEAANTCLFTTNLTKIPLSARPMSTSKIEDDGSMWFFSRVDSDKNTDIKQDNRVQLFYANTGSSEFLSIYGTAEISTDPAKIEELWTPLAKTWFTEGKEDPAITLIKVTPEDGHYWDTKSGKIVSLLKIAVGAVIGKTMDDGLEGKVRI